MNLCVADSWSWGQAVLSLSETPREDAAYLLAHVLQVRLTDLYVHPERVLNADQQGAYEALIRERSRGIPIAYLIGSKGFWTFDLQVSPEVLVPRPETECVVEAALRWVPLTHARVLDLGTGSGALILALAVERADWQLEAVDLSEGALDLARKNARALFPGIDRIRFHHGSWFEPLDPSATYDLIVSNPPYLSQFSWEHESKQGLSDLTHEPQMALLGGETGLEPYEMIVRQALSHLKPNGFLIFEHGMEQQEKLVRLLGQSGYCVREVGMDWAGLPRYVVAQIETES